VRALPETTDDYLRRAQEAARQARTARNPEERAAYDEIAALWLRLAGERLARNKQA
jgi:hypothetical protein